MFHIARKTQPPLDPRAAPPRATSCHRRPRSASPRGGGEQGGGGIGAVGRDLGFVWLRLAFRGGASVGRRASTPYVFPSSPEAASRQRGEHSSAYAYGDVSGRSGAKRTSPASPLSSATSSPTSSTSARGRASRRGERSTCGSWRKSTRCRASSCALSLRAGAAGERRAGDRRAAARGGARRATGGSSRSAAASWPTTPPRCARAAAWRLEQRCRWAALPPTALARCLLLARSAPS